MRGDWVLDAVQVEVDYRTEQLRKAGRRDVVQKASKAQQRRRPEKSSVTSRPRQR